MGGKHFKTWIYVVLSLLLLTTVSGCIFDLDPRFFSLKYEYDIQIFADEPIENATFIIPLPVKNGTPMLGPEILKTDDFIQENVTVEFTRNPPGLNLSGAEILPAGYDPWFVVIRADRLAPKEPGEFLYHYKGRISNRTTRYNGFINTLNPVGNESLIEPKYDFIWQEPLVKKTGTWDIRYYEQTIPQKTCIYADYQASPTTNAGISFTLYGSNEWRQSYDDWRGNAYEEHFSKILKGPQNGWVFVLGKMELQDGFYPNPDNPEWQRVLNQTKS